MRNDLLSLVAGGLVVLEGVALAGLAVWQLVALAQGDTASPATAIALLVLTLIGAALVAWFGVAAARGRSGGRSGGIVVQLLVLAVAIGAVTGTYGHPLNGLQLGVPALIVLVRLVSAARRAAQNARRED